MPFSVSLLLRRELSLNFKKRKQKNNLMSYAVLVTMKETGTIVQRIEDVAQIHNYMIKSFSSCLLSHHSCHISAKRKHFCLLLEEF